MAPKPFALHIQDLADVMLQLERCDDPRAKIAFDMADHGYVHPLDYEHMKFSHSITKKHFEEDPWSNPILSGPDRLVFDSLPNATQIERVLKQDIGSPNDFTFAPSLGSPERDAYGSLDLLNNIRNSRYNRRGAIIHMYSPTFDHLRTKQLPWRNESILACSNFQITIAPASEIFDLIVSQHHTISTLLTGLKVIIAYPPFHGNSAHVRTAYKKLFGTNTGRVWDTISQNLQHGIALVQQAGQTLQLPPFWSYISFTIEMAVSATFYIASASSVVQRLQNIDLQVAAFMMWFSPERRQAELVSYVEELGQHLHALLNNEYPKLIDPLEDIRELCNLWDYEPPPPDTDSDTNTNPQSPPSLKARVAALINSIEAESERERIRHLFLQAWLEFLEKKRKKKSECRLCHVHIRDLVSDKLRREGEEADIVPFHLLVEHFVEVHFVI